MGNITHDGGGVNDGVDVDDDSANVAFSVIKLSKWHDVRVLFNL